MIDADTVNEINSENYQYSKWEREQKNIILGMSNVARKQTLWTQLFPRPTYSEEINNMVF